LFQDFLDEFVENEEKEEENDIDRFNVKPQFQGDQGEKVITHSIYPFNKLFLCVCFSYLCILFEF